MSDTAIICGLAALAIIGGAVAGVALAVYWFTRQHDQLPCADERDYWLTSGGVR